MSLVNTLEFKLLSLNMMAEFTLALTSTITPYFDVNIQIYSI